MGQIPSTEQSPENIPPPPAGTPAAAATAVAPAAPAAGARQPEAAAAAVPSAPAPTPTMISDTTRASLEAAKTQLRAEAEKAGVLSFGNYAHTRLHDAIASGQAEQVKGALQEIRRSPQLEKLSSGLKDRLNALQGEVEGTLEKPMRKLEELFSTWPQWARVAIVGTGIGYGIAKIGIGLWKGGRWLLKKIGDGIKAGWDWSKAAIKGTLKVAGIGAAFIGAWVGVNYVKDNYIDKKNTPTGGAA